MSKKPINPADNISSSSNNVKEYLNHIDVTVEAFIGNKTMTIGELQSLDQNTVITLSSSLDTAVDLKLNGVSFAKGQLVAVGDNYGVKITSVSN